MAAGQPGGETSASCASSSIQFLPLQRGGISDWVGLHTSLHTLSIILPTA